MPRSVESNKVVAGTYKIEGFPTLKLFIGKGAPIDYTGQRTAKAMADWVSSQIPSLVKKVTDKSLKDFFKDASVPKVLLFTAKTTTSTLYKVLPSLGSC